MKKYIVRLTAEERTTLKKLLTSGRGSGRMFTRVRILLKADQSEEGPAWSDEKISEAYDVTVQTIERVRKQLVEEGFDPEFGARPIKRTIRRLIEDPLSEEILKGKIKDGKHIRLVRVGDKIKFKEK